MRRWLYVLLPVGVLALILKQVGVGAEVVFVTSVVGIIPLATLIGVSTEDLAHKIGPKWGGLLTATMGNAAELLIGLMALQQGLIPLVKASITGSIVGNLLLILGMGLFIGGWRFGRLRFDPREAGHHSSMMLIALGGLLVPAFFAFPVQDRKGVVELSDSFAVILLAVYAAYLFFSTRPEGQIVAAEQIQAAAEHERPPWAPRVAVGVLIAATVGTGVLAEALVGTVEVVSHTVGLSQFFVGVIVVPVVGNVAEHLSAVQLAGKGKVDVAIAISAGSSTQIALFVAPVLVLAGILMGQPMDLVFHELEIVALAIAAALFAFVSMDGESNWFEAVQLLALYLMVGVAFFFLPSIPGAH